MKLIKKISHISLFTNDLNKVYSFYIDILKLKIAHKFLNDQNNLYGLFINAGEGTFIEFFKTDKEIINGNTNHFCFEVSDINKIKENLQKSMKISIPIKRGKTDDILQFMIKDFENNSIEFHQYDNKSKLKYTDE